MDNLLAEVVSEVVKKVREEAFIKVEASGRHIHISPEDLKILFGNEHKLKKVKDLSQPGQFACEERVTISGPKGSISNVVILGPCRNKTQVEVSLTDLKILGLNAPIRQSGDLDGSSPVVVSANGRQIDLKEGLIVAKRHIHVTPQDAVKFQVQDGDVVKVKLFGTRPLIFEDVVVRISKDYSTFMHIDYDEANACGFEKNSLGKIIK